jgi:cytosine/adenosine deaminase-related metal-dependent hydrolase
VGAGTDATRVASYNPWLSLHWLVTGNTLGGLRLGPRGPGLDRAAALRLYTHGSAWFSRDESRKGRIAPGQLADLAVLSADYFRVPDDEIKSLESVLTVVGGRPVYGAGEFSGLAPAAAAASPAWSPAGLYAGYHRAAASAADPGSGAVRMTRPPRSLLDGWGLACGCFA